MFDFDDTKVAFSHMNDIELRRARRLFSLFRFSFLAKYGPKLVNVALQLKMPILTLVRKTMFNHFCGGESIVDCRKLISAYGQNGIGSILDYSVEGAQTELAFENTKQQIFDSIDEASNNPNVPFSVFKLTGLCSFSILEKLQDGKLLSQKENQQWERAKIRVEEICAYAARKRVRIFIDAEESWIQDTIDDLAETMMGKYNLTEAFIFNTIQLYRHDRIDYVTNLYKRAISKNFKLGFKLVRGAYMEKEVALARKKGHYSPIHKDKKSTDFDFNLCVEFCLERHDHISICVATHNEESVRLLTKLMSEKGIRSDSNNVWCAQLLGMSDHISFQLARNEYNSAKYVPYGPVAEVLPYLFRRAEENSSIQNQSLREYDLLETELKRRQES